jgi:hypothetical protein
VKELEDALEARAQHTGLIDADLDTWLGVIVDAAMLVANPNIEAAFDMIKKHLAPLAPTVLDVAWHDAAIEIVAAALTPGVTDDAGVLTTSAVTCETCGGDKVVTGQRDPDDRDQGLWWDTCPTCKGSGLGRSGECLDCALDEGTTE